MPKMTQEEQSARFKEEAIRVAKADGRTPAEVRTAFKKLVNSLKKR